MELKQLLKSKTCKKVLRFFHENPAAVDTPAGIAAWINEDLNKIKRAMEKLSSLGVLMSHDSGNTKAYSYTRNKRLILKITALMGKG